ncbi:methyltransferase small domain protein, partial [Tanacetum coccineum]
GTSPWKSKTPEKLLKPFLKGSVEILEKDGFIDLRLNISLGWKEWKVEDTAKEVGLKLIVDEKFNQSVFPRYTPLRGCAL